MNADFIHVLFTIDMFILGIIYIICIPYIHGSYQLNMLIPKNSTPLKTWRSCASVCRSVGRASRWFHPYCVPTASNRPRYAGSLGGKVLFCRGGKQVQQVQAFAIFCLRHCFFLWRGGNWFVLFGVLVCNSEVKINKQVYWIQK